MSFNSADILDLLRESTLMVELESDEVAQGFVGKRVVARLSKLDPELEGTVVRAHKRGFVLETDQGKVKCMWHKIVRVLPGVGGEDEPTG